MNKTYFWWTFSLNVENFQLILFDLFILLAFKNFRCILCWLLLFLVKTQSSSLLLLLLGIFFSLNCTLRFPQTFLMITLQSSGFFFESAYCKNQISELYSLIVFIEYVRHLRYCSRNSVQVHLCCRSSANGKYQPQTLLAMN